MIDANATLSDVLTARARTASDTRLAIDIAAGTLVAAAALFWRPRAWVLLVSAALCFAAFGLWGIADRAVAQGPTPALRALRSAAAVLGVLAAIGLAIGIGALGLGTIIS